MKKKCTKCKGEKEVSEFYVITSKQRKNPYLYPNCKDCSRDNNARRKNQLGYKEYVNAYTKKRRNADPEWSNKERRRMRTFLVDHPVSRMYYNAKRRAKIKGIDFSIRQEDIVIPKLCPYLNIPLIVGTKGNYESTPSIDRIDNNKGYTIDNILVVSKKGNSMKNSATFEELKTFCRNILKLIGEDIVQPIEKL